MIWEMLPCPHQFYLLSSLKLSQCPKHKLLNCIVFIYHEDSFCGEIFREESGSFKSPGYPSRYPSNANCLWVLEIPNAHQIEVVFSTFEIEKSNGCHKDYLLTSRDGMYPSKFAVDRQCGTEMFPKKFRGNRAWFEFTSDDEINKAGFIARWISSLVAPTDVITQRPTIGKSFCDIYI